MTAIEHDPSTDKPKRGFMSNGITTQGFFMVVLASTLMAIASLMLKQSLTASGGIGNGSLFREILALLSQPVFLVALVIYSTGTLLWMRVLSHEPISIGFPILVGTSFIVVAVGSVVFFKEAMTWVKLVGILVIVAGVLIASQG